MYSVCCWLIEEDAMFEIVGKEYGVDRYSARRYKYGSSSNLSLKLVYDSQRAIILALGMNEHNKARQRQKYVCKDVRGAIT